MPKFYINPGKTRQGLSKGEIDDLIEKLKNMNSSEDFHTQGNEILKMILNFFVSVVFLAFPYTRLRKKDKLYRTRAINPCSIDKIMDEKEFWEPPSQYVKYGRLNLPNESKLYVSYKDPELAIKENSEIKDYFILIEYEVIEDFECSIIDSILDLNNVTPDFFEREDKEVYEAINKFLEKLMTHKSIDDNYYEFTNEIVRKIFLKLSPSSINGYCYHSAVSSNGYNLCLNPESAHEYLKINSVFKMYQVNFFNKRINLKLKKIR